MSRAGRMPSPSGGVTPWQLATEVQRQMRGAANRDARMAQRDKETVAGIEAPRQNAMMKMALKGAGGGGGGSSKKSSSKSSDNLHDGGDGTKLVSSSYLKLLQQSDPTAASEFMKKYEHVGDVRQGNSIFFKLKPRAEGGTSEKKDDAGKIDTSEDTAMENLKKASEDG